MLKMNKIEYFEVNYNDLENAIEDTFGHRYEIPLFEEKSNDTSITCTVSDKRELDVYDVRAIDALKSGKPESFSLREILAYMHQIGIIPAGNYLIKISW